MARPHFTACALLTLSSIRASYSFSPASSLLHLRGGSAFQSPFAGFGRAVSSLGGSRLSHSSVVGLRAGATTLSFGNPPFSVTEGEVSATVILGKKEALKKICTDVAVASSLFGVNADAAMTTAMLQSVDGPSGSATTFVTNSEGKTQRLSFGVLPEKTSRHNHPMSVHTITSLLLSTVPSKGNVHIVIAGMSAETAAAPLACAVAKAFPLFNSKTNNGKALDDTSRRVSVSFVDNDGVLLRDKEVEAACDAVSEGVRLACRLVDSPPALLTTTAFANECQKVAAALPGVSIKEIVGDELRDEGYGGLFGVGQAATCPPRLVIMTYEPGAPVTATETIALVGKGIVYDTGGLSLKSKDGMPGMKHDMGGAAGMLGAFFSAVKLKVDKRLHLVLCLAENAIGPTAFRNDDILTMYSRKTVEVNNCDAEGRLVLGDGVAHATKHFSNLDLVVDMATLTGAQLVATGKKHAGVLANTEEVEKRAIAAGMHSGDLCFPLVYAPELFKPEFKSEVADMKNSVKDRMNAQTSCAGHFIEEHLAEDYKGGWLHVDMAGPATRDQRATGFGVGFILALLKAPGF